MNHPMTPLTIAEVLSRLSDDYVPFLPLTELGLDDTFLGDVYVNDYSFTQPAAGSFRTSIWLSVYVAGGGRLEISAADFLGISIVDPDEPEFVSFTVDVVTQLAPFAAILTIADVPIAFWLANDTLRRVELVDGSYQPIDEPFRIETTATLELTSDLEATVRFPDGFDVPPFAIGDTGLVCEVDSFDFDISADDPRMSVQRVRLVLPEDIRPFGIPLPELVFDDVTVSRSGFSGVVSAVWPLAHDDEDPDRPYFYDVEGTPDARLFGLWGGIESIQVTVVDNILTGSALKGRLILPYFDEPVAVTVRLESAPLLESGPGGLDFRIEVRGEAGEEIELRKDELLALYAQHIAIEKVGATGILEVTGGLEPLLWNSDGLSWPRLDVTDLVFEQNLADLREPPVVRFREAWVDLKDLATLDLFGFSFELQRVGVGYVEETDKLWIDLTGSLRLIDRIPIGLGVEGFRITWPRTLHEDLLERFGAGDIETVLADPEGLLALGAQIEVRFAGVYVFFGVPQAVEFEGLIRFLKEGQVVGFAGDMALRLPATGLALEAGLMIGMNFEAPPYPFLYLYFGILLPSGIPLGQSGLALKGAKGLFGLNVVPDRTPEQNPYYDWYKRGPIEGVHPTNKWRHHRWSVALGAGVTITTTDGKILGVQGLLVLVIPGPIIMIEGKTLIFDGIFPIDGPLKGLGYLDGGTRTVQLNIEAGAEIVEDVIDVNANLEAFFDFTDPTNWHLYLGQDEPADRRIRAELLKLPVLGWLFSGSSYLMLDMTPDLTVRARLGVAIGFEPPAFDLAVASVSLAARIDGEGLLTINPFAFTGGLVLDADLDVSAFGLVGLTATADAEVRTAGPRPLVVAAELAVSVELPVPDLEQVPVAGEWIDDAIAWFEEEVAELPDIPDRLEFSVPFSWRYDGPPEVDPLVNGVSADRAISLSDRSVPAAELVDGADERAAVDQAPVVALDAKPVVIFDQPMNQAPAVAAAGFPTAPAIQEFAAGDFVLRPTLHEVTLSRAPKTGDGALPWEPIARATAAVDGPEGLWAFWRVDADPTGGARRVLSCWTTNPFEWLADQPGLTAAAPAPGDDQAVPAGVSTILDRGLHLRPPAGGPQRSCVGPDELEGADPGAISRVEDGSAWVERLELRGVGFTSLSLRLARGGGRPPALVGQAPDRVTPSVRISFPEPVVEVQVRVGSPGEVHALVARTDRPARYERQRDGRYVVRAGDGCGLVVAATVETAPQGFIVQREEGLRCLELMARGVVELLEVCWVTRAATAEAERGLQLGSVTEEVVTTAPPASLLPADHYYRIDVTTSVELAGDDHEPLLELLGAFDEEMGTFLERHTAPVTPGTRSWLFQTDGPPRDLDRYVKWTSVDDVARVFADDDHRVRFRRSYVQRMYGAGDAAAPYRLTATVVDADGRAVAGADHRWSKAGAATELPVERDWRQLLESQLDVSRPQHADDVLAIVGSQVLPLDAGHWHVLDVRTSEQVQFTRTVAGPGDGVRVTVTAAAARRGGRRGRASAGCAVGERRGTFWAAEIVIAGEDATLELVRRQGRTSTPLATRRLTPGERERLSSGVRLELVGVPSSSGTQWRTSLDGGQELIALDDTLLERGHAGFTSSGEGVTVSDGVLHPADRSLRPGTRYRLLLAGGEGGRTMIDDRFDGAVLDDRWEDPQGTWTMVASGATAVPGSPLWWHEAVDDAEVVAHLHLDPGAEIAVMTRHPHGRPADTTGASYEVAVRREGTWATVRATAVFGDHLEQVVLDTAVLSVTGPAAKLRVRLLGDRLTAWLDERPAVEVRLEAVATLPTITGRPTIRPPLRPLRRSRALPVARTGAIGLRVVSGAPRLRRVRLASPVLAEVPFETSKFRSFADLVRSFDGDLRRQSIDMVADGMGSRLSAVRQAVHDLAEAQARQAAVIVDHRDMVADRAQLESAGRSLRTAEAAADDAFDACFGIEFALEPLPVALRVTALTIGGAIVGLLVTSPEPLDLAVPTVASDDPYAAWGRTTVTLGAVDGGSSALVPVFRADGTRVVLFRPGDDGPLPIPSGRYALVWTRIRDHGDDALDASVFDHRYDRPVHSVAGRTDHEGTSLPLEL